MTTTGADIRVRAMRPEDKPTVRAVMASAFPPIERILFSFTPDVLVAEHDGRIVGGTVLRTFPLPKGRTAGFVAWIFVAPEARGLGVGQRLIEGALALFEERGCDEVAACVEGYNTSSRKLFATRGFGILSPGEQFRRWGVATPYVWARMGHLPDIGHFIWARPAPAGRGAPQIASWAINLILSAAILALAVWRSAGFGPVELGAIVVAVLPAALLYGLRHLAMRTAARLQGIATIYRPWESGLTLSLTVALALGSWVPSPGSLYPRDERYTYRDVLPRWTWVALAGIMASLIVAWAAWGLMRWGGLSPAAALWVRNVRAAAGLMAFVDAALAFFPVGSFNGRRLWDRSRLLWAAVAAPAVALLFL